MCGLTSAGAKDGFGSQYAAMLSVVALAFEQNKTYYTTKWQVMDHGVNASALFAFVGGPQFGLPAKSCTKVMGRSKAHRLYPGTLHRTAALAAQNYYAVPKPAKTSGLVVHVRRGDVKHGSRWTNYDTIVSCIKKIDCGEIHIVTEGHNDLEWAKELNATLHIDEAIDITFHRMVSADCFVLAKSAFSWSAAFLSKGRLFSPHFKNHRVNLCR